MRRGVRRRRAAPPTICSRSTAAGEVAARRLRSSPSRTRAESLRAEVAEHGVTVTALLPGATDSDFHARAGMGDTKFGDNSWKNDRRVVARQGVEAMLVGRDAVVGGDRATKFAVVRNRFLPERVKAARHARDARPASPTT